MLKAMSIVDSLQADLEIGRSPFYVLFGDRYLRRCHEIKPSSVVRVFGITYRLVRRREDYGGGAGIYARSWPLWAVLRLREKARLVFWSIARWLHKQGLIHVRTPESMLVRWRDLGLGPDPRWKKHA